jgi:hypothetical protein
MTATELTRQQSLPTIEPARPDPLAMLGQALERGLSIADLAPLMDLIERDQANKARAAFMAAMSRFQAHCPTIMKSRKADRYSYAPLDEVLRTIRPHLDACGLAVRFSTRTDGPVITALCTVSHVDGHAETSEFAAPIDPLMKVNETQKVGSANSYAKRYALMNALNLVASDEDDDGYGAGTVYITEAEAATIRDHIEALAIDEPKYLAVLGAASVDEIPASKYRQAMSLIERKRKAAHK